MCICWFMWILRDSFELQRFNLEQYQGGKIKVQPRIVLHWKLWLYYMTYCILIHGICSECIYCFQAFAQLLEEEGIKIPAWFAFNSKDGVHVVSGDSMLECTKIAETCEKVVAVGINCTPPRFISDLIMSVKKVKVLLKISHFLSKIKEWMDLHWHAQPLSFR